MHKVTYDEMKALYLAWLQNPTGMQQDFFKPYGWSRTRFFKESAARGDDV